MGKRYTKKDILPLFPFRSGALCFDLISIADAHFVYQVRSNAEVMLYVDSAPLTSKIEAIKFINSLLKKRDAFMCKVFHDNQSIGLIGVYNINYKHHFGNITYQLHPLYWNRGLGKLVVKSFTDYLLKNSFLFRIEAQTHFQNSASIRVLQKSGYVPEGRMRGNFYFKGQHFDSFLFSKTKNDIVLN